jgi:hypothetical protein
MGRLLEPVSNGRARSMIETIPVPIPIGIGANRTRLIALLLEKQPFPVIRKGCFF